MAFRVAARTVLELGAELISSDAVAIYELVKNAIDARSKDGVTIEFCVTLRHADYVDALEQLDQLDESAAEASKTSAAQELSDIKSTVLNALLMDAPRAERQAISAAVKGAKTASSLRAALEKAYVAHNWIEFRDHGRGMSEDDLTESYLVIGTPSRRRGLEKKLREGGNVEYLGEKGVGRLSAMRLGSQLHVATATASDKRLNIVEVNWRDFEDLEKMIEDVKIVPAKGPPKPKSEGEWSGTTIRINGLNGSWSPERIKEIATFELARLSDPFSGSLRRYRVVVLFNGGRIDIPRLDRDVLGRAHASAIGRYEINQGKPRLTVDLHCRDLGKGNPPDDKQLIFERPDIRSLLKDPLTDIAASALRTVGQFTFEFYWFNRQQLRTELIGAEGRRLVKLQQQWAGIMLFRDGYRVFPYGDDTDDWLGLDRRALAAGGYKLNKSQFIGRANISRTANPRLVDQTSREGLKDCDEKTVLVELLRYVIQDRLKWFLEDVERRHAPPTLDFEAAERRVNTLQSRTRSALKGLEKRHASESPVVRELLKFFEEMQQYFAAARTRANEVEDERDRMLQLAGIGLMLEMVAHELARSTETTLDLLTEAEKDELPDDVAALFSTLRDEMKTMNRRLRVLDPLSVSGRQRTESFDLAQLVREIADGHSAQFRRHRVDMRIRIQGDAKQVIVKGIRGMFVQIVENLVQNSVYWMDLKRDEQDTYKPVIDVTLGSGATLMEYTDNGPGVQPTHREDVFTAFYSTKGKTRRQGLGLFIARDCAKNNGLRIYLSDERRIQPDRLNTFILERDEAGDA
ncbi:sensor histidine kinase [Ancylobacter mangrovi]|uniref:sensor histidine kinase n=1 Tax=Ancylobacter mangrovi TaxID=2972472 RepID=UPI0021620B2B|nr:sensor histidine kinase [Ancylobacter mangrovi]MCS0505133.1 ATP-binding protein [Ancylobacter mangrovi]